MVSSENDVEKDECCANSFCLALVHAWTELETDFRYGFYESDFWRDGFLGTDYWVDKFCGRSWEQSN